MKRITERTENGFAKIKNGKEYRKIIGITEIESLKLDAIIERLASYEDAEEIGLIPENAQTIKKLEKEIYQNAKEHGWWESPRSFGEIIALCHSELSEALEEDRAGKPMYYEGEGGKPEGIATEMADCIIRILDWFGYEGIDAGEIISKKHKFNKSRPYKHGKKY